MYLGKGEGSAKPHCIQTSNLNADPHDDVRYNIQKPGKFETSENLNFEFFDVQFNLSWKKIILVKCRLRELKFMPWKVRLSYQSNCSLLDLFSYWCVYVIRKVIAILQWSTKSQQPKKVNWTPIFKDVSLLKASSNFTPNGQFFDFRSNGALEIRLSAIYRKVISAVTLAIGRIHTNPLNSFYFFCVEKWFEICRNRKIKNWISWIPSHHNFT